MSHGSDIRALMGRDDLRPRERRAEIFAYLSGQPDRGVAAALEGILEADTRILAGYLTQYLESLPDAREAKERAARCLRARPELVVPAARLVPWLSDETLQGFIDDYFASEETDTKLAGVLFSIALNFPDKVRGVSHRIDDESTRWALLSGAPPDTVDELLERWRSEGDAEALTDLAYVRSDYARSVIRALGEEFGEAAQWQVLLALAGELPGSGRSSGYFPAHRGFVLEAGASPHSVNGEPGPEVPLCHVCEAPAALLLKLSAADLPFRLRNDPEFYWYSCDCDGMDSITARVGEGGLHVFYGPQGRGGTPAEIAPGELSLVLEEDENQNGRSVRAVLGTSSHQVGGLPRWREPAIHPRCPDCKEPMPYLATMDCGRTAVGELRYEGAVYCFWCDQCSVSSTLMQV